MMKQRLLRENFSVDLHGGVCEEIIEVSIALHICFILFHNFAMKKRSRLQ